MSELDKTPGQAVNVDAVVMWFSSLFCKHIFQDTKIEKLRRTKSVSCVGGIVDIDYFDHMAHWQKCLKCGKERVIQSNTLALPFDT